MKEKAIQNALKYNVGQSVSDGNMVVGHATNYVAVAFNQTTHNQNTLLVLQKNDAIALMTLLLSAAKQAGWCAE